MESTATTSNAISVPAVRIDTVTVLVVACMVGAVLAFLMPWVRIEPRKATYSRATYGRNKPTPATSAQKPFLFGTMFGDRKQPRPTLIKGAIPPAYLNGPRIPRAANAEASRTAMLLVERFTRKREHVGLKSYAVYLVPGLALLFGGALLRWRGRRVAIAVAVVCAAVVVVGIWQLATLKLDAPVLKVDLQPGLWLSMAPYAGLAVAALLRAVRGDAPAAAS